MKEKLPLLPLLDLVVAASHSATSRPLNCLQLCQGACQGRLQPTPCRGCHSMVYNATLCCMPLPIHMIQNSVAPVAIADGIVQAAEDPKAQYYCYMAW